MRCIRLKCVRNLIVCAILLIILRFLGIHFNQTNLLRTQNADDENDDSRIKLHKEKVEREASVYTVMNALNNGGGNILQNRKVGHVLKEMKRIGDAEEAADVKHVVESRNRDKKASEEKQRLMANVSHTNASGERILSKYAYVDEFRTEDENATYPPFVAYNPEDGPGEWGKVHTYKLNESEKRLQQEGNRDHSFNKFLSDKISVHRRLKDQRKERCKSKVYPANLPRASVIICFHNEAWSTLLRSVHSILDRSPPHLIEEIILVDDGSTLDYLKAPLRKYMSKLGKVKIIRTRKHEGLVRARLAGYELAAGPTLVFLDSHIECFPGWLEPLLDRIAFNPTIVTFPIIDIIQSTDFGIGHLLPSVGGFQWKLLFYTWVTVNQDRGKGLTPWVDPVRSPTMPGGLFAIDKQWFTTLGTYDPELLYWGGENVELSFKTWMCNGSIELVPCSHVGHIYRVRNPITWTSGGDPLLTNALRVAEVWLDDYKHIVYETSNLNDPSRLVGNVSERRKLRESLHCHDFRWYLKNIYPEQEISDILYAGEIRSQSKATHCIDVGSGKDVRLYPCHGRGRRQYLRLHRNGRLENSKSKAMCVDDGKIVLGPCAVNGFNTSKWSYTEDRTLYFEDKLKRCLTAGDDNKLYLSKCDDSENQQWTLSRSKFNRKDHVHA